jgi:hypothetical protein
MHLHLTACRHEFVVVETIDFYDDEDDELPPPLTLKDIVMATKVGGDAGVHAAGRW